MRVDGRVVVVTGAASGIGRASAERFAREGARGIVVADVDGPGAHAVADGIGPQAAGVACDVTDAGQIDAAIDLATERWGPVDLFCGNAGIGSGAGLDAPDDVWDRVLAVNVRAHVFAARRLVPDWVDRGEGHLLITASAAGLLTQIGDAPYAVSKHAAVALAEWIAVTYGDRGVGVSCLCPMGVDTPLLREGMGPRGVDGLAARVVTGASAVLTPEDVAEAVVQALADERFLITPHPEVLEMHRRKADDPDRWIRGMQRLRTRTESRTA
jgi:NAD(P)-dependent dehydrogenase (short-subunit alcohol dehydrogenase family)